MDMRLRAEKSRGVLCLLLTLIACEPTSSSKTETKNLTPTAAALQEAPWYMGVFKDAQRARLALLPDGTMIFRPLLLGTYRISGDTLSFTPTSGGDSTEAKIIKEPSGVAFTIEGKSYHLQKAAGFTLYPRTGSEIDVDTKGLVGKWRLVARAGSPMSDWKKASEVLGPSLASEETIEFFSDGKLLLKVGESTRQEKFTLEKNQLTRTPEGAGYNLPQEVRLFKDRLELGPKESPDIYQRL